MPPSRGTGHPLRLLGIYAALLALIYGLVFFTGGNSPAAKLGIDLQGGTRVTLTARTPDGKSPSKDSLDQAQQIIESRVNGLGVAGSEVVIDGDNLVITVPGQNGDQAKALASTAKLYVRPVLNSQPAAAGKNATPTSGQPATTTPAPAPATTAVPAPPTETPAVGEAPAAEETAPAPQNRVFPQQAPNDQPTDPGNPAEPPAVDQQVPPSAPVPTTAPAPTTTPAPSADDLTPQQKAQQEIDAARKVRQNADPKALAGAMSTMDCSKADPLAGNDDPNLPLVTCSTDGQTVYLLDKSALDGQRITDAVGQFETSKQQWVVDVTFDSAGGETWGKLTDASKGKQLAFTLDSRVVSAPQVDPTSPSQYGGNTSIFGHFTQATSKDLASQLKYGSLPLSFATSEAETVSASLGLSSLHAGLLAGGIGLIAVLLYCLLYYRMLGFLAGLSLVASGFAVYGLIVLLGRWMSFTLDLAGIAGLIIGIGMTADSFVVFFERIKDEMRVGRSFRSAVPRGWKRAQRTNLSGKTVSFIASAVLYIMAAGQVRGFAFTLGITTVLDVIVLFLVTAPLMMLASRSPFWAKPSVNGLGAVQQVARERKAADKALEEVRR